MLLLILGVALWGVGHLWNRFLPNLYARLGKAGYGVSAIVILTSLAFMIVGYRAADFMPLWTAPPGPAYLINNALMFIGLYTYTSTATQAGTAWVVGNIRHPQLTGFKIWAVAHLLVNGDLASVVLFGGLLAWAVVEVVLINRHGESFSRDKAPITSPILHLALALGAFVIIALIHLWLGVNPLG